MTTTNLRDDVDELVAKYQPRAGQLDSLNDPIPLRPTPSTDDVAWVPFPSDDEPTTTDLPLEALVDVAGGAIDACGTLLDTLPNLRHAEPSHEDTAAWNIHRRKAYLDAEEQASIAWRALMHAQQLVKGLAR